MFDESVFSYIGISNFSKFPIQSKSQFARYARVMYLRRDEILTKLEIFLCKKTSAELDRFVA